MLDEGLDQIIRRVVRACGGALIPLLEPEPGNGLGEIKGRFVLEQSLVHGPELLDIERRVVDPDELPAAGIFVKAECTQAIEKLVVGKVASPQSADGFGTEQIPCQRFDAELKARAIRFEQAEC